MKGARFATFGGIAATVLFALPMGAASAAPVERTFESVAARSVTGWTKKLTRDSGPVLEKFSDNGRWAVTPTDPLGKRSLVELSSGQRTALAPAMERVWALGDAGAVLYSPFVEEFSTWLHLLPRGAASPTVIDSEAAVRAADISADGQRVVYDQHNLHDSNAFQWSAGVVTPLDNGHESSWSPTISGDGKWVTVVSSSDITQAPPAPQPPTNYPQLADCQVLARHPVSARGVGR